MLNQTLGSLQNPCKLILSRRQLCMFLAFLFWKFFCDSEKVKIFKATFPMELFSVPISCSLSTLPNQPSLSTIEKSAISQCHSGYWETCSDCTLGLEFWSVPWLCGPEPSSFCFFSALSCFLRARYVGGLGVMSPLSSSGLEEFNGHMAKFFHVVG